MRFFLILSITCACYILALVLFADNLRYATNWNLAALFLYFSVPPNLAAESGITHFAFILVWAIMCGITVVTIQNTAIMDNACAQYGCVAAWTGNIILHYVPPFLLTWHLLQRENVIELVHCLRPDYLVRAFLCILVFAIQYCAFMDPVGKYFLVICIPTLMAWLLAASSFALIGLVCCVSVWVGRQAIYLPTDAVLTGPSVASSAATKTRGPFSGLGAAEQKPLPQPPSYRSLFVPLSR